MGKILFYKPEMAGNGLSFLHVRGSCAAKQETSLQPAFGLFDNIALHRGNI